MKTKSVNSLTSKLVPSFVIVVVLALSTVMARADLMIVDALTADVTSSGFAVLWKTSDSAAPEIGVAATPQVAVYSDAGGTAEMTTELEMTAVPLFGGDPDAIDEFSRNEGMHALRDLAKSLGLMKVAVHGCLPRTTYYFRISSENGMGQIAQWPENGLASVTTTEENAFVVDSKQILVTLTDDPGTLAPKGWLVMASSNETFYPVSAYVGDGAENNQAYLNLSNLFDADEDNWTPAGLKVITLEVRPPESDPVQRNSVILFSGEFHVSMVSTIEVNIDEGPDTVAPVVTASPPGGTYPSAQSVILSSNEDGYIFFTIDQTDPTTDSTRFTDPIQVDETTTLKFMAIDRAGNYSGIETAVYSIVYNRPPFVPSSPVPEDDGQKPVTVEATLAWQGGDPDPGDVVTYDVYLGTSEAALTGVCLGQTATSCQPGGLLFGTRYLWQVVAKDDKGFETLGPIWHFTTFEQNGDEDEDDLVNEGEIAHGTDPFDWDTDKDGYSDGEEIGVGTDPLNRAVRPAYPPGFGDIDGDKDIDGRDLALLSGALGSSAGDGAYMASADLNGDGRVDEVDLELFARVFGYAFYPEYDPSADFDSDGDVDGVDLSVLIAALGSTGEDLITDINQDDVVDRWDLVLFSWPFGCVDE
jgi:hypothetical protein